MSGSLLARIDARDRALFGHLLLTSSVAARHRTPITILTHLGGARASISLALWPWFAGDRWVTLGQLVVASLVLSHLIVQLVKRTAGRPRPSRVFANCDHVHEPDRFSFPSGHSAAAMSIAICYAMAFPIFTVPLVTLAVGIGATRVLLGVHYPGDVAAGQLIAVVTVGLLRFLGA